MFVLPFAVPGRCWRAEITSGEQEGPRWTSRSPWQASGISLLVKAGQWDGAILAYFQKTSGSVVFFKISFQLPPDLVPMKWRPSTCPNGPDYRGPLHLPRRQSVKA